MSEKWRPGQWWLWWQSPVYRPSWPAIALSFAIQGIVLLAAFGIAASAWAATRNVFAPIAAFLFAGSIINAVGKVLWRKIAGRLDFARIKEFEEHVCWECFGMGRDVDGLSSDGRCIHCEGAGRVKDPDRGPVGWPLLDDNGDDQSDS